MLQQFLKYGGIAQAALGVLGQAAPDLMGGATGGNVFNMLSGAAMGYLGFQGGASQQRTGALAVGGVNALVGLLGAFGVSNIAGIPINNETIGVIINLAVGAWGLFAGLKKKTA